MLLAIALAAGGATAAGKQGASARKAVHVGQVLESRQTGLSVPSGIAFSPSTKAFFVVHGRRGHGAASTTNVVTLTPFGRAVRTARAGSARLAAAIDDPVNAGFDARRSRLLFIDTAGELVQVHVSASGILDPAGLSRRVGVRLGLGDPEGLAVDPRTGTLFVLDATGPRIVRAAAAADGTFGTSGTSSIDLSRLGIDGPRGLAFDPSKRHLYVRAGGTLYEVTLQGDLVARYDLSGAGLVKPAGLAVAPSSDRTDDPSQTSVYVADSGGGTPKGTGDIVEVSLMAAATASIDFTSSLVTTVNTSAWTRPSPDPSGVTYLAGSDRLMVSDGEVEETVNGVSHFAGANVWETDRSGSVIRTANISRVAPTVVPMTNEPTGVAFDPATGAYYFSDDGAFKIHRLDPGPDQLVGTNDDSWTSWTPAQNNDPEGVAFDTFNGHLFVVDGLDREVYEYTTAGTLLNHFDVLQYGILDPEGIEFNPESGTLFVLSNEMSGTGNQALVVETTTAGVLKNTIDVSAAGATKPADIAYAPASGGGGAMHFYVVDRGVDNNSDPNENDGRMYELTAPVPGPPANTPPTVSAGPDQSAILPASATLSGSASDDGTPNPLTTSWTQVSGPGVLTFANQNAAATTASASVQGVYVARLTANDGEFTASDDTTLVFSGSGGTQSLDSQVSAGADDAEEETNNTVLIGNSDLDMMVGNEGNLVVGVRIRNVAIPNGAQITNAYLQFTSKEAQSGPSSLTIKGQAADNPGVFTTATSDISSRPTTAAAVSWSPPAWAVGETALAERTSNLSSIVQEIVNRGGWVSGNALAFLVTGTGTRVANSYNSVPTSAPRLHVEWSGSGGNAPPLITSDGGGDTASRSVAENQTAATTVTAIDPESSTLSYSISGGPDAAKFVIDSSSGVLSFANAPNYEAPADAGGNNVYDVSVTASDGQGGTDTQAIAVTVLNVNESPPVITSNSGGGTASISMQENQTAVTTVTANDGDNDPITYLISGGVDASAFTINPGTGVLAFASAPDFENPTDTNHDNVYEVTVTASDGSLDDDQALSVTITNVAETNAPPTVSAGTDQTITLPASASLDGTVTDDGLPNPPNQVTTTWSKVSGPGMVAFGDPNAVDTTASFSLNGTYVLRLTGFDGAASTSDDATITVNPASGGDLIFADGFESGSFSAWSGATTGGGDLSVSTAAAQAGTKGMQAVINDAGPIFVTDNTPASEPRYRARFWFNPNGIVMATNDAHFILEGQNSSGTTVVRVEFKWNGKKYQVRAAAAKDGTAFAVTSWFAITNAWHAIEFDWRASSAPRANSGGLTLWLDNVQVANLTAIDNDTRRVDSATLGALDGIDAGTHGTYYFDKFESRRSTYIGP